MAAAIDALTDAAVRDALGATVLASGRRTGGIPAVTWSWLAALSGRERTFDADARGLDELTSQLAAWQSDAVGGPVRACFRLVEPLFADGEGDGFGDQEKDGWRVEFALQATDEPSLIVDADASGRRRVS